MNTVSELYWKHAAYRFTSDGFVWNKNNKTNKSNKNPCVEGKSAVGWKDVGVKPHVCWGREGLRSPDISDLRGRWRTSWLEPSGSLSAGDKDQPHLDLLTPGASLQTYGKPAANCSGKAMKKRRYSRGHHSRGRPWGSVNSFIESTQQVLV